MLEHRIARGYGRTGKEFDMATVLERLTRRVTIDSNGCWNWLGAKNGKGYGCIGAHGKVQLTHRVSYEAHVGPIPDGYQIDHLCRNRACVNPAHLEPVTPDEHARRALRVTSNQCKHGHPFTGDNLIWRIRPNGQRHRVCRECKRLSRRVGQHPDGAPLGHQPGSKIDAVTAEKVRAVYAAGGKSQRAVAQEFGISATLVNFIVNGSRKSAA